MSRRVDHSLEIRTRRHDNGVGGGSREDFQLAKSNHVLNTRQRQEKYRREPATVSI